MNAVIYARKSTEDKKKQVYSINDQVNILRELAIKRGFYVIEIITEEKSAKDLGRVGFSQMMGIIYEKKASIILSWSLDRLARNQADGGQLTHMVQTGGIKAIITPDQEYNQSTSPLIFALKFGMANEYVTELSKNVKRGHASRLREGFYPFNPPYGYRKENKKCIWNEKAHIVREVFEMYDQGDCSFLAISNEINKKYGQKFYKNFMSRVLRNKFYIGEMEIMGRVWEGNHEPIINKDLFDRVQKRLEGNIKKKSSHNHTYAGRIKYEREKHLVADQNKGHVYYKGQGGFQINIEIDGKIRKQVPERYIDKCIQEGIKSFEVSKEAIKVINRVYDAYFGTQDEEQARLRDYYSKTLSSLDNKIKKAKKKYFESDSVSDEELREYLSSIEEEKKGVLEKLKNSELDKDEDFTKSFQMLIDIINVTSSNYSTLSTDQKKRINKTIIENIELIENRLVITFSPFLLNLALITKTINIELKKSPCNKDFDAFCVKILNMVTLEGLMSEFISSYNRVSQSGLLTQSLRTLLLF